MHSTATRSQAVHKAEIESLATSHAFALTSLEAKHADALESIQKELSAAHAGKNRVAELAESATESQSEVQRLQAELGTLRSQISDRTSASEQELNRAKAAMEAMRDELQGTKHVRSPKIQELISAGFGHE